MVTSHLHSIGIALVAAGVAAALSGCSAPTVAESPPSPREVILLGAETAKKAGHEEQFDALSDGEITVDEYRSALDDLTSCLDESGVKYSAPIVSPADGIRYLFEIEPSGLDPAVADQRQAQCTDEFWLPLSTLHFSTTEQVMDEALRVAVIECLRDSGYELTGDETNFPAMVGDPDLDDGEQRTAATDCVFRLAHELYPELRTISVSD